MPQAPAALVSVIMGSQSDWQTMQHASATLKDFAVDHECLIVSAHRTPAWLAEFAGGAEGRGVEVIIAGAGGAAHLPGMAAAQTLIPVLGVPVESAALKGMDSLLSIAQMPGGIPVGTMAIGKSGAINAALLAVAILANSRPQLREKLRQYRIIEREHLSLAFTIIAGTGSFHDRGEADRLSCCLELIDARRCGELRRWKTVACKKIFLAQTVLRDLQG